MQITYSNILHAHMLLLVLDAKYRSLYLYNFIDWVDVSHSHIAIVTEFAAYYVFFFALPCVFERWLA